MSEISGHRRAWELIPWVVNDRASAEERALVDAHVRECADCRSELAFQRDVQKGMLNATPSVQLDARAGLDRLMKRIDGGATSERATPRGPALVRWLAVAVVVEAVGLAALSTEVLVSAPYQTLTSSAPSPTHASLRAVFAPQTQQSELQSLLRHAGLQIVGGPSEAGVYSLAPAADSTTGATGLAALRADPHVLFAEPLQ